MSYKNLDIKDDKLSFNIIKDISNRKEYFSLKPVDRLKYNIAGIVKNEQIKQLSNRIIPRYILEKEMKRGSFLRLHSYQLFIKNFINPNTPYTRLLVKWETGTGKTIGAISLAMNFIDYYKKEAEKGSLQIGSIFIIGFSRTVFKKELLKYPELKFISRLEMKRLNQLKIRASRGIKSDIENLQEFVIRVRKRFSNRKHNGFFKFFGYKEFVNRIFLPREDNTNINSMNERQILDGLKVGKIKFNDELLDSFHNSLIICDEIHNVYNSADKNNWGIAIQSVLNNIQDVRAIFLSATPLNNSPTEVVDLMNLLLPEKYALKKEDFFSNIKTGEMKKGALEKIKQLSIGRVSYLKDTNPLYFPSKAYVGESIHGIQYLRFIRCPMSPFHYNTYKKVYTGTLTQDSQYLIDFALPNPECDNIAKSSECLGMYQTKQINSSLSLASQSWKDKYGLDIENNKIVGDALEINKLKKYSSKYSYMLNHILDALKKEKGKIFIYHNIVHISGVLFIQEILKKNGIISEFGSVSDNTLCSICGKIFKTHVHTHANTNKNIKIDEKRHDFMPAKFMIAHAEIDKSQINKSIEKYNNPDNAEGHDLMILIGSKLIKESYDIKAVRQIFIMGRPDNISTLIQIIGRGVRNNSHIDLPPDKRHVDIKIFTSCLPIKDKYGYIKSYEEIKYGEKINDYKIIQNIEKKFHEGAVDIPINLEKLFELSKSSNKMKLKSPDPLGPLEFSPDYMIPKNFSMSNIIKTTFETFYSHDEMNYIVSLIKRLFIERDTVWTYEQLFDAVKSPPILWRESINTLLLDEENFLIALSKLLWTDDTFVEPIIIRENIEKNINDESNKYDVVIESMIDPNDKIIILPDGQHNIIVQIDKYYCLMPLNVDTLKPVIDIEMPYRKMPKSGHRTINIKRYLEDKSPTSDYPQKKLKFKFKYQSLELNDMEDAVCDYGSNFHQLFIEEAIEYIFNLLTGKKSSIKNEFNDFYYKMIYYYDIIGIIIWADSLEGSLMNKYAKYIDIKNKNKKNKLIEKNPSQSNIIRILESSINKANCVWCPKDVHKDFYESMTMSLNISKDRKLLKKMTKNNKVPAFMLPVGHFILDMPRFLDVSLNQWIDIPSYVDRINKNWKENDLIIGYDSKSKTGVHVRFKLRSPVQDIERFRDTRKIEKGSICSSKSKTYLLHIINELKIKLPDKININVLCNCIRSKLIYNEIQERKIKKSIIKWFYGYYEKQPTL